ncbi:MAG TPA: sulfotransferase [Rhizomicrobium sp.]|jgi:tetratricopeptide (TPR) repeat protein
MNSPTGTLGAALARARDLLNREPVLAEEQAREILRAVPDQPDALLLRGRALALLERPDEAIAAFRRAADRDPRSADAWRLLGDALVLAGDGNGADAAYARQIKASVHDPRLQRAASALCDNDMPVAEKLLRDHLKEKPTDVAAIRMLAELAGRLGRNADARNLLERAIELAPSFAPARFNLATVLYRQSHFVEAIEMLDRLLEGDRTNAAYRNLKGAAEARLGNFDDAIVQFEQVLARRPDHALIWLSYGHALKTIGRQGDSIAAYRRAIALMPGLGEAWWSLANLKTMQFSEADRAAMEKALGSASGEEQMHFDFALGKAYEDVGQYEIAFRHYADGNRLRRAQLAYNADETSAAVARACSLFTPEFFAARDGQGAPDDGPIFVIGMPRSGSTLVEQILASHPMIEGTQELPDILRLVRQLTGGERACYPTLLADLDAAKLRALGEGYLESTRPQRKTARPFFIDKMPNNWLHAGLIHLILPNAKIIDVRRHPLACCFSNFKQHFAVGQAFSYSLADMGRYYTDYVALMAHFDAALPGLTHRVFYEALIDDAEGEIRRLLDYLGLPFDSACLRFHETARSVRTASSEQVRKPIFREGLDHWRRFALWLAPLESVLRPLLARYPHGHS